MTLGPREALTHYVSQNPSVTRYCVAYSGGIDSHVLLLLCTEQLGNVDGVSLRALHINHQIAADSEAWASHASRTAEALGVAIDVVSVEVDNSSGEGPEAAARAARYGAFARLIEPGEHLLLAQHADDQAETFLLQALRGSGPDGLASIPSKRTFANGVLARPLLGCQREAIAALARDESLDWIEDSSNTDTAFDRNYLRHEVMPKLLARWPAAARTLSRSAMRSAAASQTLLGLAQQDLDQVLIGDPDADASNHPPLSVSRLARLPRERTYNALRLWVRQAGYRMPRLRDLAEVAGSLMTARVDAQARVNCREYVIRRHRDRLHLLDPTEDVRVEAFSVDWLPPHEPLRIDGIDVTLTREACLEQGFLPPESSKVVVKSRSGSELIKLGETYHKAVKKLLQESGIPPWRRDRHPLVYIDGRLAAVWEVAVSIDHRRLDSAVASSSS